MFAILNPLTSKAYRYVREISALMTLIGSQISELQSLKRLHFRAKYELTDAFTLLLHYYQHCVDQNH